MRVYILKASKSDGIEHTESAFSSYSAMLTWLKEKYNFESEITEYSSELHGLFKDKLLWFCNSYSLRYEAFDVIGEHSVTTDKIEFK